MPEVTITCAVPRSVNATNGSSRWKRHRLKTRAQADLAMLLLAEGLPRPVPGDRVHAVARIVHPAKRRRDEGNYRAPLEKALGDALCPPRRKRELERPAGWLSDDTPEHFTFGAITFDVDPDRAAYCELTLTYGAELEAAA